MRLWRTEDAVMMWTISHDARETLAARLLSKAAVVAPANTAAGEVVYDEITAPGRICWDYSTSLVSLKRFFFPQVEPLFEFSRSHGSAALTMKGGVSLQPILDARPRVFLGIRPCDVRAVGFMDTVFNRDFPDPYYQARRENSLLIALACNQPGPDCFCVCGEAGPALTSGYDLQLTALADGYLAEVGSSKGAALVEENKDLFRPAGEKEIAEKTRLVKAAENSFGEPRSYFAAALRKISFGADDAALWRQMGEVCFGCGGCSFICPTCNCFTTFDRLEAEKGIRERHWDACSFACFTREASSHNPRKEQGQRLKARFFHKLSYQFVKRNGRHACVGCGRCIRVCLGENPMPEVTARLRRGEMSESEQRVER